MLILVSPRSEYSAPPLSPLVDKRKPKEKCNSNQNSLSAPHYAYGKVYIMYKYIHDHGTFPYIECQ